MAQKNVAWLEAFVINNGEKKKNAKKCFFRFYSSFIEYSFYYIRKRTEVFLRWNKSVLNNAEQKQFPG